MRVPLGDQAGAKAPPCTRVSWRTAPAGVRRKICELLSSLLAPA
jgi:hypothetical protein